jgi:hypothetical protein
MFMNKIKSIYYLLLLFAPYTTYVKNFTILVIGDSSAQFMFYSNYEELKNRSEKIIRLPTVTTDTNHCVTCFMKPLRGKTIHGLKKISLDSLITPHLIHSPDAILLSFGLCDTTFHIEKQCIKQSKTQVA